MLTYAATYSPEDNKIRLSASGRLDPEIYARVKAAGFAWAPQQEVFVAPMWTPAREDLALELAGEIGDEDISLVERAEARAERFSDYSEHRRAESEQAHHAMAAIADAIPLGQPILVGHHSEQHARKDAQRIQDGMAKTVRLWEQADYWQQRAKGAIRHAKYKELPAVRARRIKGLEADLRKQEKVAAHAVEYRDAWQTYGHSEKNARDLANYDHISQKFPLADYPRKPPASQYEGAMSLWSALDAGVITATQAQAIALPAHERTMMHTQRWIAHLTNRLAYERALLADAGGTVADQTHPEKGGACQCWASPRGGWSYIVKVNKVSVTVLDNWGNGGGNFRRTIEFDKLSTILSKTTVDQHRADGILHETNDGCGFYLMLRMPTDAPAPVKQAPSPVPIAELKAQLKTGIQVATVPQLFPTPRALAERIVTLADIHPGDRVLEPSAGTGRLVDALDAHPAIEVTAIDISPSCADALRVRSRTAARVLCADFLTLTPGGLGMFDAIVMNPPFAHRQYLAHLTHAVEFLKPGGRLVAVMPTSLSFGSTSAHQVCRALLDQYRADILPLPSDTFEQSGTSVNTVLVVLRLPTERTMLSSDYPGAA